MNMRRILYSILILLCTAVISAAQNNSNGKISGMVQDASGKPIASATVSLLHAKDARLVKAAVTAKDGSYEFDRVAEGEYLVSVTAAGFDKIQSGNISVSSSDADKKIAALQLNPAVKDLTGVTLTSKKPFIEAKIDKTVVNVDASPTNAGATALEVLEKSPGVMVNNDGIISLRGKSGVIVMMDGKQTFLSPTDLANLLKNMPASALDQIEIMTNPSARYDASGNSGIINIKTKKGKAGGFNGSIMAGITTSFYEANNTFYVIPKSQNSFTFNYRKNKINFFGNYNPNISAAGTRW